MGPDILHFLLAFGLIGSGIWGVRRQGLRDREKLETMRKNRHIDHQRALYRELDYPVDWELFEQRLELEFKDDNWKPITERMQQATLEASRVSRFTLDPKDEPPIRQIETMPRLERQCRCGSRYVLSSKTSDDPTTHHQCYMCGDYWETKPGVVMIDGEVFTADQHGNWVA